MELSYCDNWAILKKKPWKIIDEETAKMQHINREPYTAILSNSGKPKFLIKVVDTWITVSFMDDLTRKYLQYDFELIRDDYIFLKGAIYWEYEGNSDKEISKMIYKFEENGHFLMEKRNLLTGEVDEREANFDSEKNWDKYPKFGQYMYLCREER